MSARSGRTPHGILNFPPIFPRISTSGPVCYFSSEAPGRCRNQSRLRDIVDRIVLSKISVTFLFFRFRIKMKESKLSNYSRHRADEKSKYAPKHPLFKRHVFQSFFN